MALKTRHSISTLWLAVTALAAGVAGCEKDRMKVTIDRPFIRPAVLAVAPVLNFSGEFSLDPVKAADLLASELAFVDGVTVLPVSRVVAVLASQSRSQVESPAHALEVAEAVGADAILVAGVTEYDAYTPVVGLVLQMYVPDVGAASNGFDPVLASRMSEPFAVTRMADPLTPSSQVQLVSNAAHRDVRSALQKYAAPRLDDSMVMGWRQYMKVQTLYLRFCWHEALARLMRQERSRWKLPAADEAEPAL